MDTLRDLVKEQGIVNIIMDYKEQMNHIDNFNKYKDELKESNRFIYNNSDTITTTEVINFSLTRYQRKKGKVVEYSKIITHSKKELYCIINIPNKIDMDVFLMEINNKYNGRSLIN